MQETPLSQIDDIMRQATLAFEAFRNSTPAERAALLEAIAVEIEALGDTLINTACEESNLPAARLTGERGRTTGQLRLFAAIVKEGSWADAVIDTALPDRAPPRPDLRKMLFPIGPVVVFGASNFPLAFSTAGGDTASALAAGCSVIIKAHPAHPATSTLVFEAIQRAIAKCNAPSHLAQHVLGNGFAIGRTLVEHPATKAVGFTGSAAGGKSLLAYAQQRDEPIPVFAEMGSINPVVLLPQALSTRAEAIATAYAGSITLGMGQFCTNPGLLLAIDGPELDRFLPLLAQAFNQTPAAKMLHTGIHTAYMDKMKAALAQKGVDTIAQIVVNEDDIVPDMAIAQVDSRTFIDNPLLKEEVFGPYSLVVRCRDAADLESVLKACGGQLTITFMAETEEIAGHRALVDKAAQLAGRVVFNGVPTGVEVSAAMMHGGPYPASSDSRFTSVGTDAIKRWARPVCFQNCPEALLPPELHNENPMQIIRRVNSNFTHKAIT
ncbi:MAG: aldehyde dehydrogenase (NADP(+)) [Saprospiraceae bacterium]|nr:aldehyde dehydrogenase (NADP(+)) [Saprospiraceae bacterium]